MIIWGTHPEEDGVVVLPVAALVLAEDVPGVLDADEVVGAQGLGRGEVLVVP